jgi:hypothetical protein
MRIRFFDEEKKQLTVIINGEEVTNPVARWLIIASAIVFVMVIVVLLVLIVLPLVGVTIAGSLVVAALALLLVIPLLPLILIAKAIQGRSAPAGEDHAGEQ